MEKQKKGEYLAPEIGVMQLETGSALLDASIEISGENPEVGW